MQMEQGVSKRRHIKFRSRGITFTCISTLAIRSHLFFLLSPPMQMEQSVSKRRYIKFRSRGITFTCISTLAVSSHLLFLLSPPMKMEQTRCSETSERKIQTPGNHPPPKKKNKIFRTRRIFQIKNNSICYYNFSKCIKSVSSPASSSF